MITSRAKQTWNISLCDPCLVISENQFTMFKHGSFYYEHFVNVGYIHIVLRVNLSEKNQNKHLAFLNPDPISVSGFSYVSHISLIFEGLSVTTFPFQSHTVAFTPRLSSPHGHYRISNTVFCFLALGSSRCCWRCPNAPPLLIPVTSVPELRSEFIYRGRDTGKDCSGHPVNSRGITLREHVGELTQITAHRIYPSKTPTESS